MFVAVNNSIERVVGPDTAAEQTVGDRMYRCLFCDEMLHNVAASQPGPLRHLGTEPCQNLDHVSHFHRIGQELVSQQLCNWLPVSPREIVIDLEKQVGIPSNHIIADVRIQDPIQLVVEVVYRASTTRLRDRLRTAFANDYGTMVVVLTNADSSPSRIERDLADVGPVSVGRVNPFANRVTVGSVITPDQVDLTPAAWESVPAYLA